MFTFFRYRRYRVFLAFAVIATFALYRFATHGGWVGAAGLGSDTFDRLGLSKPQEPNVLNNAPPKQTDKQDILQVDVLHPAVTEAPVYTAPKTLLDVEPIEKLTRTLVSSSSGRAEVPVANVPAAGAGKKQEDAGSSGHKGVVLDKAVIDKEIAANQKLLDDANAAAKALVAADELAEAEGRKEVPSASPVHWVQQPEHFPVATTIQLPTGSPKSIPRIQHRFGQETEVDKAARLKKLKTITDAASHSWKGYKDNAWMHDEVKPQSGGKRDPFCGWAATLVDALDTLWLMGFKDEFEDAVAAVATIDFTTSSRKDIPLFETTIRYLGGMVGAYDISGGKYPVLLDKSVELADILMGAFDTPNRMPMTFYHWMPTFASQPHRATTKVVLAEIGSLSVEFTRLAQLTKEPRYYDAIARITDAFDEWQSRTHNGTLVPGLWPTHLDASGCEKPVKMYHSAAGPVPQPQRPTPADDENAAVIDSVPVHVDKSGQLKHEAANGKPAKPVEDESQAVEALRQDLSSTAVKSKAAAPNEPEDEPIMAGHAGIGKIKGWGHPIEEGKLDNKGAKIKAATPVESDEEPIMAGHAGIGKIKGWGNPIQEGGLDSKDAKEKLLNGKGSELGSSKTKRQLAGVLSQDEPSDAKNDVEVKPPQGKEVTSVRSTSSTRAATTQASPSVCNPTGLFSATQYGSDKFTIGGMADSVYEYLPKEWVLLGGLVDQYRDMYGKAVDAATKTLLYRPMTPDNQDILFAGEYRAWQNPQDDGAGTLIPEGAHLTCFAGGMYAMGAKLFDREEDLELAARLTEGCVWAYASTNTGIMPERFMLLPCKDMEECEWNQTAYNEALDPYRSTRIKVKSAHPASKTGAGAAAKEIKEAASFDDEKVWKREVMEEPEAMPRQLEVQPDRGAATKPPSPVQDAAMPITSSSVGASASTTSALVQLSHKDFVAARIEEERLPPGVTKIMSKSYILRPEAIESVWYMYRITGNKHWREVGWDMFTAIQQYTVAEFGNSAIDDVTATAPELLDQEESFWLAETLKYFFLLFSEEHVLSLDEWILNTEAHPFRRPDFKA